jgi:hypothetical protein
VPRASGSPRDRGSTRNDASAQAPPVEAVENILVKGSINGWLDERQCALYQTCFFECACIRKRDRKCDDFMFVHCRRPELSVHDASIERHSLQSKLQSNDELFGAALPWRATVRPYDLILLPTLGHGLAEGITRFNHSSGVLSSCTAKLLPPQRE